jgi:uncharacterized NAD-dependent epimerase/dehydratase family protein
LVFTFMNYKLTPENRLALLMHDTVGQSNGKMGYGLMRYGVAPVVVVIDRSNAGRSLRELTGIDCDAPIVASVAESLAFGPDTLVPAIAPPGGALPEEWWRDVKAGLAARMSLVNGLHRPLANDPELATLLRAGRWIWDVRQEPAGLDNGMGRAKELACRRVLFVGTDMACGKMTAALEMHHEALRRGMRSRFVATGQIGIAIAGEGVPLDAVRIDFATGAVEQEVMRQGADADVVWIEGQGSLLHPASTATLALMRGAAPTDLILVHRAGQEHIARSAEVRIPPLVDIIKLNESVCSAAGALPAAKTRGIALNCGHLTDDEANHARAETERETGLPCADVVRPDGAARLVDVLWPTNGLCGGKTYRIRHSEGA